MSSKKDWDSRVVEFNSWKEACEEALGISFLDWKAFMLFCFLEDKGKRYFETLPAEVQGQMIVSSAMIDQARSD